MMAPRPFKVVSREQETPDTFTLVLEPGDGKPVRFRPGQFMMLYVFGIGEVPISVAGNPGVGSNLVHTIRAVGAVTEALCALEPGDDVGVRGPYGTSWPVSAAKGDHLLIIAGGIGLAPLRPAVLEAMGDAGSFRSLNLLYGSRSPADILYKTDLLGWESSTDLGVEVTVDRALSDWRGDVGLVTALLNRVDFEPAQTVAFVCGPEIMMKVVARELRDRGVRTDSIWVSLERNMKCAVGFCGHCQYGPDFLCKTGPVMRFSAVEDRLRVEEL